MLGSLLGADTSSVSPHLFLWQHCHIPILPHRWTCCRPNLCFSLKQTCTAPLTQPLPHLLSRAPQLIPSQLKHWFVSDIHPPPCSDLSQFSPPLNPILTRLFAQAPPLSYHFDTHSTQPFPPPQQRCTWVVGESRRKSLVERWDRLPACSSCTQASLLLSHGGCITEMLLSVPVIGASWTALKDLLPGQPSAQINGGNMLSKDRIRNISLELCINTRDSSECVLTAIFRRLTICPNLHKKGKKYIHWQKPPPLTKYWLPASKLI